LRIALPRLKNARSERVESNAIPQKVGVYGQILSDVLNVHAGAQQGTTPNPQYYKKTLSSDIYEKRLWRHDVQGRQREIRHC
jgi:hypothetical protein